MLRRSALLLLGPVVASVLALAPSALASPPVGPRDPRPVDDACPPGAVPEDGFADVPAEGTHEAAVDCVVHWGIAKGLDATSYGPGATVTRAQMASFIARLVDATDAPLPGSDVDHFSDDDTSTHEASIDRLAAVGIVGGRGPGVYDPDSGVTRAQMAAFLTRAVNYLSRQQGRAPLPAGTDAFGDDDGNALEAAIDTAAAAGLAGGYGDGSFRPAGLVRRDQMASFLTRVLDLAVEEGMAALPGQQQPADSPPPAPAGSSAPDPSATPTTSGSSAPDPSTSASSAGPARSPSPSPSAEPDRSPDPRPSPAASTSSSPSASPTPTASRAPSTPPASSAPAEPAQPAGPGNTRNCGDFGAWSGAQEWFERYSSSYGDVANLDPDGDLLACEHLHDAPGSPAQRAAGPHEVDIVQVHWTQPDERTLDSLVDAVAAADAHLTELTGGNVDLTLGRTTPWVEIPAPAEACDLWAIMRSAEEAAGFVPAEGRHLIAYFPEDDACGSRGFGNSPGSSVWLNGAADLTVVVHELLHNVGLLHADSVHCYDTRGRAAVEAADSRCQVLEAGDPYDPMGHNSALRQDWEVLGIFGLASLLDLGAVGQPDVPEVRVGDDQVFTLNRSTSGQGLRGLRVTQDTRRYVVEYRAEPATDELAPGDGEGGVLVRRDDPALPGYDGGLALMDFRPDSDRDGEGVQVGAYDLRPGATWRSPDGTLTVTTQSVTADTATVRVSVRATG